VPLRLLEAIRDLPKVCKHLHLPVQSGSTRVLSAMRRRYTRESYLELVATVRAMIPDITLTTDMIVGFPAETPEDFHDTMTLTAAVRYESMFSFKYSPRPNTLALQRMPDDVTDGEKTARIVALQALQREIDRTACCGVGHPGGSPGGVRAAGGNGASGHRGNMNFPGPKDWVGRRRAWITGRAYSLEVRHAVEMTIKGLMVDPVTNVPDYPVARRGRPRVLPIWVGSSRRTRDCACRSKTSRRRVR
jgi:hypothetical protein